MDREQVGADSLVEGGNGTRREFLRLMGGAASAAVAWGAAPSLVAGAEKSSASAVPGASAKGFRLAPLPYGADALEAVIDAQTMEIHHGRHHKAYVDNLNKALEKAGDLAGRPLPAILADLDSVPEAIRQTVRNNGGGHLNHTLFWELMTPGGPDGPEGALGDVIKEAFGSLDGMKEKFVETGLRLFGSGWVWLEADADGGLHISGYPNQDNPVMKGRRPVLGNDVWEHAYYLRYQNRRKDYLEAWWKVVNWAKVAQLLEATPQEY